ncbi:hypothetical protein TGAM01_v210401 [Trichoderma gamsii]|uniref:Uncharacterized protein n=1 Tax=Trichoderma gamsii TaxID=398673 RepID=A0A2P4Z8Y7_9HYPO|nr:hypothetical protein TGAM01_v210401 [Trichoderma gamsii]PON20711.1 hypothetical protein TGAM01_v210401 [Trichoderma gamsii]
MYAGLVAGRRALGVQEYPRPGRAAAVLAPGSRVPAGGQTAVDQLQKWQRYLRYPRLLPEDGGYVGWQIAFQAAAGTLYDLLVIGGQAQGVIDALQQRFPHGGG